MLKINLGGTCGNSKWRNELIEKLDKKIEYRNPIVKNGTWKYNKTIKLKKENDMKECDYLVYVITPKQKGFSSIASAVDYSNKVPKKVIFCILKEYENEKENTLKQQLKEIKQQINDNSIVKIGIVIGPEGGLEEKDVELLKQNGAKVITLGKRILRTETVALNVLSIIMYELEN